MLKQFSCVEVYYLVGLWLQLFAGKGFFRTGAISSIFSKKRKESTLTLLILSLHDPQFYFPNWDQASSSFYPLEFLHVTFLMRKSSQQNLWNHLHLLEIRNLIAMVSCCVDCQSFIHYVSGNRILVLLEVNCPCL